MANTYTTSKTVRLYDQRSPNALLHPETELQAVVASSGGVVNIEGNSIWVSASDIHDAEFVYSGTDTTHLVAEYEVGSLAFNSLCVESATGGTVTATGTTIGGGNGAIITSYSVTPTVRNYDSASDNDIPTEKAVAGALLSKQATLIPGQGIVLSGIDGTGRQQIDVNIAQSVGSGSATPQNTVPSESAVRDAIDIATINLSAAIVASGYATSAWSLETFALKGEAPGPTPEPSGSYGSATYASIGMVRPVSDGGLTLVGGDLTLTQAVVYTNYASASDGYIGGAKVINSVASATAAQQTIPYVPHAHAVYAYVSNALTPYAPAQRAATTGQTGVVQVGSGLYMSATSALCMSAAGINTFGGVMLKSSIVAPGSTGNNLPTESAIVSYISSQLGGYQTKITSTSGIYVSGATCTLSAATSNVTGGVMLKTTLTDASLGTDNQVPTGSAISKYVSGKLTNYQPKLTTTLGVAVNGASISLNGAPVVSTYATAYNRVTAGSIGGVAVMSTLASATSAVWKAAPVVPTVEAVYSALNSYNGPFLVSLMDGDVYVGVGDIYLSDGTLIAKGVNGRSIDPVTESGILWLWVGKESEQSTYSYHITVNRLAEGLDSYWIPLAYLTYNNGSIAITQIQRSDVVIDVAADYVNDFAVSFITEADPDQDDVYINPAIKIAAGTVYVNGSSAAVATVAETTELTADIPAGSVLWLQIAEQNGSYLTSYDITWSYTANTTSIPIAKLSADGKTITQYQHGPIVLAGPAGSVAGQGGGGLESFTISSGSGISITDSATNGCTIGIGRATSSTLGGVIIGSGISVSNGTISVASSTQGYTITPATGIDVTDATAAGCVVGVRYTTPISAVDSALTLNIDTNKLAVSNGALTFAAGVTTDYTGPFAVSYADSTATISGGYIKTKDNVISAVATSVTAVPGNINTLIYLNCSSGYKCKKVAVPVSDGGTYSIVVAGGTYNRSTPTTSAECWSSGAALRYTARGLLPQINTPAYTDEALTADSAAITNYDYKLQVNVSSTGATADTAIYYKPVLAAYDSAQPATKVDAPFYVWVPAASGVTNVPMELGTQVAFDPVGSWIQAWSETEVFAAATPVTGNSAVFDNGNDIPIAEVNGGTVRQLQYGDITYHASPEVYHGDFNIQKMAEVLTYSPDSAVTYTDSDGIACERYRLLTERYVYVNTGDETPERWGLAGLIYGVPIGNTGQWCLRDPLVFDSVSGGSAVVDMTSTTAMGGSGAWIHDIAIEYPEFNGNVSSGGITSTWKDITCLYLPTSAAMAQVWLNVYKGTNSNFPGVAWHVQLDSQCLENLNTTKDRYSVLLANVVNGKVYQVQSGAIDIRGRWA